MYTETIKFTDFNGNACTEKHSFNLTKAELLKLEATTKGGYAGYVQAAMDAQDSAKLWNIIEELIAKSYGVKSADGRRFIKNQEVLDNFIQTEAYSELIMKYLGDADAFANFINGVIPSDLAKQVAEMKDKPVIEVAGN